MRLDKDEKRAHKADLGATGTGVLLVFFSPFFLGQGCCWVTERSYSKIRRDSSGVGDGFNVRAVRRTRSFVHTKVYPSIHLFNHNKYKRRPEHNARTHTHN